MTKHYAYFDAHGEETRPPQIACDSCGKECFEESYLCNSNEEAGEEDICPACYLTKKEVCLAGEGIDEGEERGKRMYSLGVLQNYGETVVAPLPARKKARK